MISSETNLLSRRGFLAGSAVATLLTTVSPSSAKAAPTDNYADKMTILTDYYEHHDADYALDVPEEGFGGWKTAELAFSRKHTALICMHAWDAGRREDYPGWYRAVPYIPRSYEIGKTILPRLLDTARQTGLTIFHVVGGGDYYKEEPGYKRAVALAPVQPEPSRKAITKDPIRDELDKFRHDTVFPGAANEPDIARGFAKLDFMPQARPLSNEGIAENGPQLQALCAEHGINHLVYVGFAINWCLLLSPGGMAEMQRYGLLCSAIREATTAVENRETARNELNKREALWRVALNYGFVFGLEPFLNGLAQTV